MLSVKGTATTIRAPANPTRTRAKINAGSRSTMGAARWCRARVARAKSVTTAVAAGPKRQRQLALARTPNAAGLWTPSAGPRAIAERAEPTKPATLTPAFVSAIRLSATRTKVAGRTSNACVTTPSVQMARPATRAACAPATAVNAPPARHVIPTACAPATAVNVRRDKRATRAERVLATAVNVRRVKRATRAACVRVPRPTRKRVARRWRRVGKWRTRAGTTSPVGRARPVQCAWPIAACAVKRTHKLAMAQRVGPSPTVAAKWSLVARAWLARPASLALVVRRTLTPVTTPSAAVSRTAAAE